MSGEMHPSVLRRALRTPLVDLLRGRTVDGSELATIVSTAGLPAPLTDLVRRATKRTRLWPAEQLDVARELIAHFRDGLDSGETTDHLVDRFGDPERTAKLIRRARLRGRPLTSRAMRSAKLGLVFTAIPVLIVYAYLFVRLHATSPGLASFHVPAFVSRSNSITEQIPDSERAWPLYDAAAARVLGALEKSPGYDPEEPASIQLQYRPGHDRWKHLVTLLGTVSTELGDVRKAALGMRLGFELEVNPEEEWLWLEESRPVEVFQFLPHVLEADTFRALVEGDGKTAHSNVATLIGMSRHARGVAPYFHWDGLGFAILYRAVDTLKAVLAQAPELLSSDELRDLSHRFAALGGREAFRWQTEGDREAARLWWGRLYSGVDGDKATITKEGLERLRRGLWSESPTQMAVVDSKLLAPALPLLIANRRELKKKAHSLFEEVDTQLDRPFWRRENVAAFRWIPRNTVEAVRYLPFLYVFPFVGPKDDELTLGKRDAALVILALELYRRHHGGWPETLEDLTPQLLPAVPMDRYDGQPLRYRVVEGRPLLYSIGSDGDDDGGKPRSEICDNDHDWVLWRP